MKFATTHLHEQSVSNQSHTQHDTPSSSSSSLSAAPAAGPTKVTTPLTQGLPSEQTKLSIECTPSTRGTHYTHAICQIHIPSNFITGKHSCNAKVYSSKCQSHTLAVALMCFTLSHLMGQQHIEQHARNHCQHHSSNKGHFNTELHQQRMTCLSLTFPSTHSSSITPVLSSPTIYNKNIVYQMHPKQGIQSCHKTTASHPILNRHLSGMCSYPKAA